MLLDAAGYTLFSLGRLLEATQPMRSGLEARIELEDWENAANSALNLSQLALTLGNVSEAIQVAEVSIVLADRSCAPFLQLATQCALANALHQANRWEESDLLFRRAEAIQSGRGGNYPRLSSLHGYLFCDLLLSQAEPEDGSSLEGTGEALCSAYRELCGEVRERAEYALEISQRNHTLRDIALNHLSLARAYLGLALTEPDQHPNLQIATDLMDGAVDGLRHAGVQSEIPRSLLPRSEPPAASWRPRRRRRRPPRGPGTRRARLHAPLRGRRPPGVDPPPPRHRRPRRRAPPPRSSSNPGPGMRLRPPRAGSPVA